MFARHTNLSARTKWVLLLFGSLLQGAFVYLLYPFMGSVTGVTTFVVPILASLILGLRAGLVFTLIGALVTGTIFSLLEPVPFSTGIIRLALATLVNIILCIGASRLSLYLRLRLSAETALADQEGQYRLIFENSADGIVCLDASGIILDANPAVETHIGFSPAELIGVHYSSLGALSSSTVAELNQVIEAKARRPHEKTVDARHKNGSLVVLEVSLAPLQQQKNPTRWIGKLKNITEKRNLEAQLQHSQRMEAIGRLAGGMAHDINNILNVIMGSSFALNHEMAGHGRLEDLENIIAACDRGAQLTRNLLGFARKDQLETDAFSLNAVVKIVLALLDRTMPKNIRVVKALEDPPPYMEGDQGQIENAVMNLGLNAIDAMGDRGQLTVSTYSNEGTVTISIADTGTGIDAAIRDQVFEPFFTTKPPGKGTGLGLSMVYGVVKTHNGTIDIESTPGRGSEMKLTFPRSRARTPQTPSTPYRKLGKNTVLAGKTVLMVDDEAMVLRAGRRMLGVLGCEVIPAETGERGLALFKEHRARISLVLLDLVMPEMDGIAVLKKLREIDQQVPVLIASGYVPEPSLLERIQDATRNYTFITKPYRAVDLVASAESMLTPDEEGLAGRETNLTR